MVLEQSVSGHEALQNQKNTVMPIEELSPLYTYNYTKDNFTDVYFYGESI